MLIGHVEGGDDADFGHLRVLKSDYENADQEMIRKAFDFSVSLLQSEFAGVVVEESSASVIYQDDSEKKPHEIVTAEKVLSYLEGSGYRRRT